MVWFSGLLGIRVCDSDYTLSKSRHFFLLVRSVCYSLVGACCLCLLSCSFLLCTRAFYVFSVVEPW